MSRADDGVLVSRERVQRLEEEVRQLQVKRAREERASDRQLQHQVRQELQCCHLQAGEVTAGRLYV